DSTIPLGLKTSRRNSEVTIRVNGLSNVSDQFEVFFYDSVLETKKKMSESDCSYTFFNKKGNQENRFYLLLSDMQTGINTTSEKDILISVKEKELFITSKQSNKLQKIKIYNIQGQLLQVFEEIDDVTFQTAIDQMSGVYIVEVNTENWNINKKIIIE
ncbi:T9SS type A sorting domain-containing protein, partial [Bacteroidales bacterium OttesenSCG-928-M06]|nr:T9SS type A sorting domain-containing protein [Bacteroidales bacterium OttesenSCG-928-M06]